MQLHQRRYVYTPVYNNPDRGNGNPDRGNGDPVYNNPDRGNRNPEYGNRKIFWIIGVAYSDATLSI